MASYGPSEGFRLPQDDTVMGTDIRRSDAYQFTFIANWNWRGSYAAVACPALVNSGLTAAVLFLLAMLNMSTMKSALMRSVNGMRFENRISPKAVHGVTPALRPRLPSS